jgi:hypothetical protein
MMKQAVGKAQSLLGKLSELKHAGKTDEFTLQTIAKEAKEIKHSVSILGFEKR